MTLDFTLEQQKLKLALTGDYLNFDDEDARLRLLEALRGGGVCSVSVNAAASAAGIPRWLSCFMNWFANACAATSKSVMKNFRPISDA